MITKVRHRISCRSFVIVNVPAAPANNSKKSIAGLP